MVTDFLKVFIIVTTIMVLFLALVYAMVNEKQYPQQINYYENGIKVEAIEYHNEIYLKKGN